MGHDSEGCRRSEAGFTLIELLMIVLIIGILAAIALPQFLGQQAKGQDATTKSDARNAITELENCFAATEDYGDPECSGSLVAAGLPATVTFTSANDDSYVVTSLSASTNVFRISKSDGSAVVRSCVSNEPAGGCRGSTW